MKRASIKNYDDAFKYLKGKQDRPYANNTRIEMEFSDYSIVVRYHGNRIVTFYKNGIVKYSSSGWQTVTTKERLNWYLPDGFYLYQEKRVWYLAKRQASRFNTNPWKDDSRVQWKDGLIINTKNNTFTMPK